MFELKRLSDEAIPAALEKALRYRLLNEPAEAALPNIDLKVSKQMPENIQNENQRGNRHDKLFANGGLVKGNQRVIGELPDRNSWPSRSGHDSQLLKSLERCQSR